MNLFFLFLTALISCVENADIVKRQVNACVYLQCLNGGSCVYFRNIATCQCRQGWYGNRCELVGNNNLASSALCSSQFCLNGGRCIQYTSNQAVCFCINGFSGLNCEIGQTVTTFRPIVNLCQTIFCLNGGTCTQLTVSSAYCRCLPKYLINKYF